jgi:hypothetical protein
MRANKVRGMRITLCCSALAALAAALAGTAAAQAADDDLKDRPLSAAQTALFETPHLQGISHPETLEYSFQRTGMEPFTDTVDVHIDKIHPDGTKYVSFDFLSGERRVFYPAVDNFRGNPLLMVFLEHDVQEMKGQIGVAAAYLRNRVRDAFVDRATVADSTIELDGKTVPAQRITLKPYADDPRFEHVPSMQGKTYSFILSDKVPGELQALEVDIPADPDNKVPAWSEKITFAGEKP